MTGVKHNAGAGDPALVALKRGDVDAAERLLCERLKVAPDDRQAKNFLAVARLMRAQAAERAGQADRAATLAQEALALDPERMEAHDLLCRVLAPVDKVEAARHALMFWRMKTADRTAASNLWQLYLHMGDGAVDLEKLEGRLLSDPNDPTLLTALGNALRRAGRALAAENLYRRAAEIAPDAASFIASRLACLCVEQGRLEEADDFFCAAADRHGHRDAVTRVSPAFIDQLRAAAPPVAPSVQIDEGAGVANAQLIVYVACDAAYFRIFAPSMLKSLFDNAGLDFAVALHIINAGADTDINALIEDFGRDRFAVIRENVDLSAYGEQTKTYYACSRFLQLPDLMARWRRPMLMLDADLMAIRPLAPLLARSAGADIGLMSHRLKRFDIWSYAYADVVHIAPTPAAATFFDLTRRYVAHFLKPGTAHWFLDQAAMAGVLLAGYRDTSSPRLVFYPEDIHSTRLMVDDTGGYWTDETAYFYSVRASAGGARALDKAVRRMGTIADLRRAGVAV
jgi:tetratricopeptide (TPR) repeat protein